MTISFKSKPVVFTAVVIIVAVIFLAYNKQDAFASNLLVGSCNDTNCRGSDVYAMGCAGNVSTITQAGSRTSSGTINNYVITYLRKSNDCNSLWSRADKLSSYSGNWMLSEVLECANNDCIYTTSTPPPNPSAQYYYYPWSGNKQTASPGQTTSWYSDMVAGSKKVCARGWIYTSNIASYVTSSSVWRSWACNDPGS